MSNMNQYIARVMSFKASCLVWQVTKHKSKGKENNQRIYTASKWLPLPIILSVENENKYFMHEFLFNDILLYLSVNLHYILRIILH